MRNEWRDPGSAFSVTFEDARRDSNAKLVRRIVAVVIALTVVVLAVLAWTTCHSPAPAIGAFSAADVLQTSRFICLSASSA